MDRCTVRISCRLLLSVSALPSRALFRLAGADAVRGPRGLCGALTATSIMACRSSVRNVRGGAIGSFIRFTRHDVMYASCGAASAKRSRKPVAAYCASTSRTFELLRAMSSGFFVRCTCVGTVSACHVLNRFSSVVLVSVQCRVYRY